MSTKSSFLKGKNILVTGGTGSIGTELVKQCLASSPNVVRILSNDENSLFESQIEFGDRNNVRILHGDVRDYDRMLQSFESIDVVFHAAAMKHVPICEYDPMEAVRTNVIGTQNVIMAAIACNVHKVITISTDKAVNPTTTMGTTKLMAEKLTIDGNHYTGINRGIFSCVRFGNVMSSRGSVIPLFQKQILEGGPVTVTNKSMTRFFMSIPEAVNLVLKSSEIMKGMEIFVLKSMSSIRIIDLAETMIERHYEVTGKKIKIEIIGKRPGEKNLEFLMTESEMENALESDNFYLIPAFRNNFNYEDFEKPEIFKNSSEEVRRLSKSEIRNFLFSK